MSDSLFLIISLALSVVILALVIMLLWKASRTTGTAPPLDLNPVITKLEVLSQSQAQMDRTMREELARSRGEFLANLRVTQTGIDQRFGSFQSGLDQKQAALQVMLRDSATQLRNEVGGAFRAFDEKVGRLLTQMLAQQAQMATRQQNAFNELRNAIDGRLALIQTGNEQKLEQMRQTVDEKLQGTLEARLGASFKHVSERLEQLYKGLGEVQSLASGVGDLKRVFTNVKTRGTWGEVQLGAILEQIMASAQYERNVATTGTAERVEFAIKLPGHQGSESPIWLPVDAKFPIEDYQRLVDAAEKGDVEGADRAGKQLEVRLKGCAKDISQKYIAPPMTTDFGILFLPTEGLYAEAMRRPGLAESIQREYRVTLTGPSTLAALLTSLQMGFRTLAIQERSSAAWETLGAVKLGFEKYAELLGKVRKKLTEAQGVIDTAERRTQSIQKSLRDVETTGAVPVVNGHGPAALLESSEEVGQ